MLEQTNDPPQAPDTADVSTGQSRRPDTPDADPHRGTAGDADSDPHDHAGDDPSDDPGYDQEAVDAEPGGSKADARVGSRRTQRTTRRRISSTEEDVTETVTEDIPLVWSPPASTYPSPVG